MRFTRLNVRTFINKKSKEVIDDITTRFARTIDRRVRTVLRRAFIADPAFQSLASGQLRAELGLTDAGEKTRQLIDSILESIKGTINTGSAQSVIGRGRLRAVRITGVPLDFQDLLSKGFATQLTEKGQNLTWLNWMLLGGRSRIIVRGYSFSTSFGRGRSGQLGRMRKTKLNGGWRVPSQFSGVRSNNFITRAIRNARPALQRELKLTIESAIRNSRRRR